MPIVSMQSFLCFILVYYCLNLFITGEFSQSITPENNTQLLDLRFIPDNVFDYQRLYSSNEFESIISLNDLALANLTQTIRQKRACNRDKDWCPEYVVQHNCKSQPQIIKLGKDPFEPDFRVVSITAPARKLRENCEAFCLGVLTGQSPIIINFNLPVLDVDGPKELNRQGPTDNEPFLYSTGLREKCDPAHHTWLTRSVLKIQAAPTWPANKFVRIYVNPRFFSKSRLTMTCPVQSELTLRYETPYLKIVKYTIRSKLASSLSSGKWYSLLEFSENLFDTQVAHEVPPDAEIFVMFSHSITSEFHAAKKKGQKFMVVHQFARSNTRVRITFQPEMHLCSFGDFGLEAIQFSSILDRCVKLKFRLPLRGTALYTLTYHSISEQQHTDVDYFRKEEDADQVILLTGLRPFQLMGTGNPGPPVRGYQRIFLGFPHAISADAAEIGLFSSLTLTRIRSDDVLENILVDEIKFRHDYTGLEIMSHIPLPPGVYSISVLGGDYKVLDGFSQFFAKSEFKFVFGDPDPNVLFPRSDSILRIAQVTDKSFPSFEEKKIRGSRGQFRIKNTYPFPFFLSPALTSSGLIPATYTATFTPVQWNATKTSIDVRDVLEILYRDINNDVISKIMEKKPLSVSFSQIAFNETSTKLQRQLYRPASVDLPLDEYIPYLLIIQQNSKKRKTSMNEPVKQLVFPNSFVMLTYTVVSPRVITSMKEPLKNMLQISVYVSTVFSVTTPHPKSKVQLWLLSTIRSTNSSLKSDFQKVKTLPILITEVSANNHGFAVILVDINSLLPWSTFIEDEADLALDSLDTTEFNFLGDIQLCLVAQTKEKMMGISNSFEVSTQLKPLMQERYKRQKRKCNNVTNNICPFDVILHWSTDRAVMGPGQTFELSGSIFIPDDRNFNLEPSINEQFVEENYKYKPIDSFFEGPRDIYVFIGFEFRLSTYAVDSNEAQTCVVLGSKLNKFGLYSSLHTIPEDVIIGPLFRYSTAIVILQNGTQDDTIQNIMKGLSSSNKNINNHPCSSNSALVHHIDLHLHSKIEQTIIPGSIYAPMGEKIIIKDVQRPLWSINTSFPPVINTTDVFPVVTRITSHLAQPNLNGLQVWFSLDLPVTVNDTDPFLLGNKDILIPIPLVEDSVFNRITEELWIRKIAHTDPEGVAHIIFDMPHFVGTLERSIPRLALKPHFFMCLTVHVVSAFKKIYEDRRCVPVTNNGYYLTEPLFTPPQFPNQYIQVQSKLFPVPGTYYPQPDNNKPIFFSVHPLERNVKNSVLRCRDYIYLPTNKIWKKDPIYTYHDGVEIPSTSVCLGYKENDYKCMLTITQQKIHVLVARASAFNPRTGLLTEVTECSIINADIFSKHAHFSNEVKLPSFGIHTTETVYTENVKKPVTIKLPNPFMHLSPFIKEETEGVVLYSYSLLAGGNSQVPQTGVLRISFQKSFENIRHAKELQDKNQEDGDIYKKSLIQLSLGNLPDNCLAPGCKLSISLIFRPELHNMTNPDEETHTSLFHSFRIDFPVLYFSDEVFIPVTKGLVTQPMIADEAFNLGLGLNVEIQIKDQTTDMRNGETIHQRGSTIDLSVIAKPYKFKKDFQIESGEIYLLLVDQTYQTVRHVSLQEKSPSVAFGRTLTSLHTKNFAPNSLNVRGASQSTYSALGTDQLWGSMENRITERLQYDPTADIPEWTFSNPYIPHPIFDEPHKDYLKKLVATVTIGYDEQQRLNETTEFSSPDVTDFSQDAYLSVKRSLGPFEQTENFTAVFSTDDKPVALLKKVILPLKFSATGITGQTKLKLPNKDGVYAIHAFGVAKFVGRPNSENKDKSFIRFGSAEKILETGSKVILVPILPKYARTGDVIRVLADIYFSEPSPERRIFLLGTIPTINGSSTPINLLDTDAWGRDFYAPRMPVALDERKTSLLQTEILRFFIPPMIGVLKIVYEMHDLNNVLTASAVRYITVLPLSPITTIGTHPHVQQIKIPRGSGLPGYKLVVEVPKYTPGYFKLTTIIGAGYSGAISDLASQRIEADILSDEWQAAQQYLSKQCLHRKNIDCSPLVLPKTVNPARKKHLSEGYKLPYGAPIHPDAELETFRVPGESLLVAIKAEVVLRKRNNNNLYTISMKKVLNGGRLARLTLEHYVMPPIVGQTERCGFLKRPWWTLASYWPYDGADNTLMAPKVEIDYRRTAIALSVLTEYIQFIESIESLPLRSKIDDGFLPTAKRIVLLLKKDIGISIRAKYTEYLELSHQKSAKKDFMGYFGVDTWSMLHFYLTSSNIEYLDESVDRDLLNQFTVDVYLSYEKEYLDEEIGCRMTVGRFYAAAAFVKHDLSNPSARLFTRSCLSWGYFGVKEHAFNTEDFRVGVYNSLDNILPALYILASKAYEDAQICNDRLVILAYQMAGGGSTQQAIDIGGMEPYALITSFEALAVYESRMTDRTKFIYFEGQVDDVPTLSGEMYLWPREQTSKDFFMSNFTSSEPLFSFNQNVKELTTIEKVFEWPDIVKSMEQHKVLPWYYPQTRNTLDIQFWGHTSITLSLSFKFLPYASDHPPVYDGILVEKRFQKMHASNKIGTGPQLVTTAVGEIICVTISITVLKEYSDVIVTDGLVGGLSLIDDKFTPDLKMSPYLMQGDFYTPIDPTQLHTCGNFLLNEEMGELEWYCLRVPRGTIELTYITQAQAVGRYGIPAARAYLRHDTSIVGMSAASRLTFTIDNAKPSEPWFFFGPTYMDQDIPDYFNKRQSQHRKSCDFCTYAAGCNPNTGICVDTFLHWLRFIFHHCERLESCHRFYGKYRKLSETNTTYLKLTA